MLLILISSAILSACSGKPHDLNWPVEDFAFTDQNGQSFGLADLKNKVWISDFVYTHCTSVCPPMTANMTKLQQKLKEAGVKAEIVSFSVDPGTDTPQALKSYVGKFGANQDNWHLLTGYTDEKIQAFAQVTFKTAVQKDTASDQVIHGTSFFLIDQTATIVMKYDGLKPDYDKIVSDVKALQR
ncbi:SCO family protein [Paenibacillaceae bacterium T2]|uniref:SCO family protein n=2 Tax=Ferviditalea candida TaxID=3108399 RepID=A0ABU5ZJF6_9BACL|nr:SCO family protein [Paenibacillaceae bacterium T2]